MKMLKHLKANCFSLDQNRNLHHAEKWQKPLNLLNKICFHILTEKLHVQTSLSFSSQPLFGCLQSAVM